eukprot:SRR837773.14189.p2 GENE.SRR837773.14189~~SRR837773.14189.p2  ORF type:complete len:406 (+),score=143.73 SRR837773.14189:78-1220(+)
MKAHLEAEAQRRGIGHAVHFAGSVKSGTTHLKALFKSCDAVIVPSRNEPFGIVVLEAWAAGKPVVATTCGGPRDFVTPDRDGYLVDPNPGSIAWGVCRICENFEHARWMGAQAREKALNEFNWAFIAMKTQDIYYQQLNLAGCPFARTAGAGQGASLAADLLGPHRGCMGVLEDNIVVDRGLALLKQSQLLASSLGSDGVLTWMGSEFGQIDSPDPPRPGNGFTDFRIAYEAADDKALKFKHVEMFNLCLNRTEAILRWLEDPIHMTLVEDEEAKVLAYARGGCVFVFNFHPTVGHDEFMIAVPVGVEVAQDLEVVLDSHDKRFGGAGKGTRKPAVARGKLSVALPPRTALVLAPAARAAALATDRWLSSAVDDLIDRPL